VDGWAELLEDALVEKGLADAATRVLTLRAAWQNGNPAFRETCVRRLQSLYRDDPARKPFLAHLGLEKNVPIKECLRRLETLRNLTPGVICLDKTWGVGPVTRVDPYAARVAIDFSRKRGHEMSFAYAAETLQRVGEDHLQVRVYRDAAAVRKLADEKPADVVRMALRSYGPLTVARLQELLCDVILKPDAWKPFWDAARKVLKSDPLVVIPAKRSEPLTLLEKATAYDETWFKALAAERTAEGVFGRLDDLAGNLGGSELDVRHLRVVGERLAFLMKGFGDKDISIRVQILMAARQWKVAVEHVDWEAEAGRLLTGDALLSAAALISSKRLSALLALLAEHDKARLDATLVAAIPRMTINVLNTCMEYLLEQGGEAAAAGAFRDQVSARSAGVELLLWLAKRPERLESWGVGSLGDLVFQIMPVLEKTYTGDRLRAANQLSELVQQREWLEAATARMSEVQRTSLVRTLRTVMGKVSVDTQAMIGRLVMLHPELARLMEDKRAEAEAQTPGNMTSWRSYRQRQRQLAKVVNEDIPRNSKDIAVARSYGDLRENFEYKTAKEQQGILMRRQAELDQDLKTVRGTDFLNCPTAVAGMGTRVVITYPDAREERYYILGEWDQDTGLGIISCSSRMGKALTGHAPGDEVTVPGDQGEAACRIKSVGALPEDILAWARDTGG
jgi:transcription elongation GreA/GreB family factor